MGPLLLAIPCYNCAPQVKRVLDQLLASPFLAQIDQILLMDNCSLDETFEVARAMAPKFAKGKFLATRNSENQGLGGSFKKIMSFAAQNRFEYVCVLHGDDQAMVADIPRFLEAASSGGDAYLGARFMPESTLINYNLPRKWANIFLNKLMTLTTGQKIFDIGSGLNFYRVKALPKSFLTGLPTHLAFDVHVLLFMLENRMKMQFLPITWKEEDQVSNARNIPLFTQIMGIFFEWRIRTWLKPILRVLGLDKSQIFTQK